MSDATKTVEDDQLPPVAVDEKPRWTPLKIVLWVAIALLGGIAWTMLAIVRAVSYTHLTLPTILLV